MSTPRRPTTRSSAVAALALLVLPLILASCGVGTAAQVGLAPTRDWPTEMKCPPTVTSVCGDDRLTLLSTINEPKGTTYGISSSNEDVFVICRWPAGAPAFTCEQIPPAGAQIVGEAGVYRVDD